MKEGYAAYGLILVPLTPLLNILPISNQNLFYPSDAVVLLVVLCYLGSLFFKGFRLIRTDIDLPFMGYSLVASLAVLVSLISKGDMAGNVRLLKILFESCLVYYITVSFLTSRKDLMNKVILAVISVFFVISALAVYQFLRSGSVPGSVFNDSEALGIYLTLVLPLIPGIMLYGYSGTGKVFLGIIFPLGCVALFLSSSRTGWISGAITLSIMGVHHFFFADKNIEGNSRAGKRRKAKAFLAIPTLSGVLYCLWFYYVQKPIRDVFYLRFMSIFSDHTLGGRVELWKVAWQLIQDSPLLGHGAIPNIYNLYLQVAAQFGLVALILFLFVFMKFFGVTLGRLKNIKSPREFGVVLGGSLGVLGLLIGGMAESSLGSRMSPLFWMQVGMVMALQKMTDKQITGMRNKMPYCFKNVVGSGSFGRSSITIVLGLIMFMISAAQAQAIDMNVSDDGLSFVFQNDGDYTSAHDDDTKQQGFLFLGKPEGKRHLIRFGDLGEWIKGERIEIIEAELRLYYYDEWWTQNVYHVAVARSLDGTVNSVAKTPESEVKIYGDKFPKEEKTPRPSWISFPIRLETVEDWVLHSERNHGLVVYVSDIERHEKSFGLWLASCSGQIDQRPQLYVKYRLKGNGPPTLPKLNQIPAGWRVCREASISWLPSRDPNGDEVRYELEEGVETARRMSCSKADVVFDGPTIVKWKPTQNQLSDARHFIRIRASDSHGAASNWAQIGPFVLTDQLMTIWGAHGNRKIRPHFLPSQDGGTVRIAAARNEWEPFQVIISPHTNVNGLTVTATALDDGAGHKIPSPILYVERYIDIKASPNPWGEEGLWPDALVPLIHPVSGKPTSGKYGGDKFNLVLGENLVFWADVYVGEDVHPGTYKGDVIVKAEGMPHAVLPIEFKVYNFTLPSPKHLTAVFQMGGGALKHFHGLSKLHPSDPKIKDLPRLYEEELHNHYINNWSPITGWNYTANGMKVKVTKDNLVVDWSQFDRTVTPYMDGTAYKDGIPAQWLFVPYWLPVKAGPKATFTERDDVLLTQFVREVVRHFKEKGWLDRAYYWVVDEPFISEWKYNFFLHIARIVRREAPELKILVTDVHKEADRLPRHVAEALDPYIDVWDPTVQQVVAGWNVRSDYYLSRKKAGLFDIWCQTIMSAAKKVPWLNLYPEYPMSFHRIWGWYSWKYGFQGIEWWDTVLWWDTQKKERIDPWTNPMAFRSDRPVNCEGRIFYPGTSEAIGGSEIPISSLRLKAIRETIEDYEYLYLLLSLGGDKDISPLMEMLITLDERYTRLMKKPLMILPGGTPQERKITSWWEADENALMEARARIAELIEKRTAQPRITF